MYIVEIRNIIGRRGLPLSTYRSVPVSGGYFWQQTRDRRFWAIFSENYSVFCCWKMASDRAVNFDGLKSKRDKVVRTTNNYSVLMDH
jgi:hypothetical protein